MRWMERLTITTTTTAMKTTTWTATLRRRIHRHNNLSRLPPVGHYGHGQLHPAQPERFVGRRKEAESFTDHCFPSR